MAKARRTNRMIRTVEEAIDAMGGRRIVGDWWGVSKQGLSDMVRRKKISGPYHLQAYVYLMSIGKSPQPSIFGLSNWSELFPPHSQAHDSKAA